MDRHCYGIAYKYKTRTVHSLKWCLCHSLGDLKDVCGDLLWVRQQAVVEATLQLGHHQGCLHVHPECQYVQSLSFTFTLLVLGYSIHHRYECHYRNAQH